MLAQGRRDFAVFLSELQGCRASLNAYGARSAFVVSDFLFKAVLLFRCHPTLRLRVRAVPSFSLEVLPLDKFVSLMSNTWIAMVAEPAFANLAISTPSVAPSAPLTPVMSHVPSVSSSTEPRRPISSAEREALQSKGGCFNCGRCPTDPDWKVHGGKPYSRHCPGNVSRGIAARNVVAAFLPVERAGDVCQMFNFCDDDTAMPPPAFSVTPHVAAIYGSRNIVHHASGVDVFFPPTSSSMGAGSSMPLAPTVAAVVNNFQGFDYEGDENEEIDDDEDDLVFGSDYADR